MSCVIARDFEPFESLLRRFHKACDREGILKQYRLSQLTPRERRKYKQFVSERRRIKRQKRIQKALERVADLKVPFTG